MANPSLPPEVETLIDDLVAHYVTHLGQYRRFLKALHQQISDAVDSENGHPLSKLVHSVKFRLKDQKGFKRKLIRKWEKFQKKGESFPYTKENLFQRIGDLAGYRILHLHTRQFAEINSHLVPLLEEAHKISEGPIAKTWDDETKRYYKSLGVEIEDNERMYSSVHYLVQPNSALTLTIEIQVRTLADEIWGEIDHKINYPEPHETVACREQILALARLTSSCSRLVDAVMTTHDDWEKQSGATSATVAQPSTSPNATATEATGHAADSS